MINLILSKFAPETTEQTFYFLSAQVDFPCLHEITEVMETKVSTGSHLGSRDPDAKRWNDGKPLSRFDGNRIRSFKQTETNRSEQFGKNQLRYLAKWQCWCDFADDKNTTATVCNWESRVKPLLGKTSYTSNTIGWPA